MDILGHFAAKAVPVHWRVFGSTPGFYPFGASTSPAETTKMSPDMVRMLPEGSARRVPPDCESPYFWTPALQPGTVPSSPNERMHGSSPYFTS